MDAMSLVERIFNELFGTAAGTLRPDTSREQVDGWDSVAHIKLLLMLENEGISLEPDEAVSMHTVGDVVAAVQQQAAGE